MKKIFFIATILLTMMLSARDFTIAQTKHVQFKGIPVDGTLSSFVNKLKTQGFEYLASQDGIALLTGKFAGYPSCDIYVVSTNNTVWKVVVEFPEQKTLTDVMNRYDEFKQSFKLKYNVEPQVLEELAEGYKSEQIAYLGFKNKASKWYSLFEIPGGTVVIEIQSSSNSYGNLQLRLDYYDEMNSVIRDSATMDDI